MWEGQAGRPKHPGITLWDPGVLTRNIDTRLQATTETQVIAFDKISDKAHALNISAALKASFLGGLVTVDGAAKYLCDTPKSTYQARVALKYSATTHFKQMTMRQIGQQHIMYPEVFDQGIATHVVVGILYGANAFFIFDQMASSSDSLQNIQAKLHVMVTKMPLLSFAKAGHGGEICLDEQEKTAVEKFSCIFYGDFALDRNPTTYEDALRIYSKLPKMLGSDGEKSVPITVWLFPLSRLNSRATRLVREVSSKVISDTEKALEKLMELGKRCNDLLRDSISTIFPEILQKIFCFKDLCEEYRLGLQRQLAEVLPSIRGGGAREDVLLSILRKNEQSAFSTSSLNKFLDLKYREMYFVKFFLGLSKGKVSSQDDLVKRVLDPRIDAVIAYTFTSLQAREPFLEKLNALLDQASGSVPTASVKEEDPTPWFEDKKVLERAQNAALVFAGFSLDHQPVQIRFLVTSKPDESNPGAEIFRYCSGSLEGTKLEVLSKPLPPLIDAVSYDRFQLTFQPAEPEKGVITGYYVRHRVLGEETWEFAYVKGTEETFWVTGLEAKTKYEFRYAVESKLGLSQFSDGSRVVETTLRSSPPGKPTLVLGGSCFGFQVQIIWSNPSFVADGIAIKEYKLRYRKRAEGGWFEHKTGGKTESVWMSRAIVRNMVALQVIAVYEDRLESDPSEEALWGDF
ncbi:verrucotoxin subunit beta-like isoform X2 [Candoia aspera]|uniref:verrucotoxin subunit beta-like isoform X2 n=1 Tax=Candoia aspera TaxID=51853 RepID=UPI002FD7E4EF